MTYYHTKFEADFEADLLPASSTKLERVLEKALRLPPEVWQTAGRVGDVKTDLLDETVPFMIWELGLEPVMPYISEPRRVLRDGREWQKIRGTPVSITMSLGWIDVKAAVEENPEGLRWDLFQLGLDDIPSSEKQIADIIGLAKLSKASNTELIRIYSGYDLRGARLNKARLNGPCLINDWSGAWIKEGWPKLSFGHSFVGTAEFGANWPLLGWRDTPWPKGGFKSRQIYRADSMERFKRQRGFRVNRHRTNGPERIDPLLSQGRNITAEVVRSSNLALRVTPWPDSSWPEHGLPTVSWPYDSWPEARWADIKWPAAPWPTMGWKAEPWADDSWRLPDWPDGGWPARSWQLGGWEDKPHARLREKPWPLGPWRAEHYDLRPITSTAVPYQVPYDAKTFTSVSFLANRQIGWLLGPWAKHWPRHIEWPTRGWPDTPLSEWPFGAVSHSERLDTNVADISHRKPAAWPYDSEPQVPHSKKHWPGPWSDNPWPPEKWTDKSWLGAKWADQAWPGIGWPNSPWYDAQWQNRPWSEAPWFGADWQDRPWPGTKWSDRQWPGSAWGDKPWPATPLAGGPWPGAKWQNMPWLGIKWADRQWYGSAWGDKVWPAIGWMNAPWPQNALPSVPWPDGEPDGRWGHDAPWPGISWPVGVSDDHIWSREQSWPAGVPWPDASKVDKRWGHDVPWPATGWHKSLADDALWGKSQPWPAVSWPDGVDDDAVWGREAPWPGVGWPDEDRLCASHWLNGPWLSQNWPDDPWRGAEGWIHVAWHHERWPQSNIPENGYPSVQWFTGEWPDWPLPEGRWPEIQSCHAFKAKRVLH